MNPKQTRPTQRCLALLMLLTMALNACRMTPTPPPAPTAGRPTVTATPPAAATAEPAYPRPAATATPLPTYTPPAAPTNTPRPTAAPPTATPAGSPTPVDLGNLPMPAPRLLYFSPSWGEEQLLDAPIILTFDQPMDHATTEAAFAITPTVAGTFSWMGSRTVAFAPSTPLLRGVLYRVQVAPTARNVSGEPLVDGTHFEFHAAGYLEVNEVQPPNDAAQLDPDTVVTVFFNRPVVALTAVDRGPALPQPLLLDPPVPGHGEWLNTSIYVFYPDGGLLPATRYTATIAAGLEDTLGGILAQDYHWSFTTVRPAVNSYTPASGVPVIYLEQVISVTFNQPMDHTSAQEHFALRRGDERVSGRFRWSGGETPTAPETMAFVPTEPLARNTRYAATVSAGARPRAGRMALERATAWSFTTLKNPGLVSIHVQKEGVEVVYASPMQVDSFRDYLTITPTVSGTISVFWRDEDRVARIQFPTAPATTYTLTVSAAAPDHYGVPVGAAARTRWTLPAATAYAYLNTSGLTGVFDAATDAEAYAAYRNVTRLDLALHQVSPEDYMTLLGYSDRYGRPISSYVPKPDKLIKAWTVAVDPPPHKDMLTRIVLNDGQGQPLPPGLYLLKLTAPGVATPSYFLFSRSHINLTLKQGPDETLVWATDLATGRPIAHLPLRVHTTGTTPAATGTTNADGLFRTQAVGWDPEEGSRYHATFVLSGQPGQSDFCLAFDDWNGGIQAYDFDVNAEYNSSGYRSHLYTERPIYRPEQTVYFKGIVRYGDDAQYTIPDLESVTVVIRDPQWKEVYQQSLPLSDMGTFSGELALSAEAALGRYYISLEGQDWDWYSYASTSFRVAEYKKPEYQVAVTPARPAYGTGETIAVDTLATYYFGGPVSDAVVHWSVLSRDYYFRYQCPQGTKCPWYSWTDYDPWYSRWNYGSAYEGQQYNPYGRLIAEGDAKTDTQGQASYQVQADIAPATQSQVLTIESSVTDISGQEVSSRATAIVHQGDFYVGVAPRGYLARAGREKEVDLLAVDWDSRPVAGAKLTIVLLERRWYSVRRQENGGYYYWDWTVEETPVLTQTVTTDAEGRAEVTWAPAHGGTYRVRALGVDAHGNEIRSSAYFWVWGGTQPHYWRRESNNRIDLVADQRSYEVGDVAEILVPSPYTGTVYALVTIERGHILATAIREIASGGEALRIPIVDAHVPNVFVSVVLVQGSADAPDGLASFKMGLINLPVSNAAKELQIQVTPNKDIASGLHYAPRETATYDILVTDAYGTPVEAELSLRLADLAVLALANETAPALLDRYWYARGLSIRTSMPLVVAMEAYNREIKPGEKGGSGGGEEAEEGFVRTRFADTAYWAPAVRTGRDGRAQVTVELPDNLTTWRMQAIGITADTRVGRTDVDVLTTLDVLVRSVLPRFFVAGDQARIGTIVHNNTNEPLETRVQLTAAGLVLEGPAVVTVTIAPHDKARVDWPVTVPGGEQVQITMTARAGGRMDGRADTLPVYHYATPDVVATAGHLGEAGLRQELVEVPGALRSEGELRVQIEGSLTAASRDALGYLEHYPYECVEQTTSRFLPNVFTYATLKEMGLSNPDLETNLTRLVGVGLQRLYDFQHYDGGWGWWQNDENNLYMTAYVLQGMLEAHRAGFAVDKGVLDEGATYLHTHLPAVTSLGSSWQANRLAYALYVLAEYDTTFKPGQLHSLLSPAIGLLERRHLLDSYGQATLAVALGLIEPQEPVRANALLADLVGDAVRSSAGTHWVEGRPDYWNMNTDVRSTAIVIWALSRLAPESELLPGAVRWLMSARQEGYWQNTNTTAWSLLALVSYMRASGEMQGDFSYAVYLNGEVLGEGDIDRENLDEPTTLRIGIAGLLVEETNRLIIQRLPAQADQTGRGQLYYSVYLRYYLPVATVQALDRGIVVGRSYSLVDRPAVPVQSARVGDLVRVKVTIVVPDARHYVVVESPLPAGCEGVDASLLTTSVVGERPALRDVSIEERNRWYWWYGWGWWWFSRTEMRDEKVVLFAGYLRAGTYEYTYLMRASVPGEFQVLPAQAYQMYFPEIYGRSEGGVFTVAGE